MWREVCQGILEARMSKRGWQTVFGESVIDSAFVMMLSSERCEALMAWRIETSSGWPQLRSSRCRCGKYAESGSL